MALRTKRGLLSFHKGDRHEPNEDVVLMPHSLAGEGDGQYNRLTHPAEESVRSGGRMPVLTADVPRGWTGKLESYANIWIYSHGDASSNYIYTDKHTRGQPVARDRDAPDIVPDMGGITPMMVVEVLEEYELDEDYAGNIVVWTCFSGRLGGFAETFAHCLQRRGFASATVFGVKYATGCHCLFFGGEPKDTEVGMLVYKSGGMAANVNHIQLAMTSSKRSLQRNGRATYACPEDLREIVPGVSMQHS